MKKMFLVLTAAIMAVGSSAFTPVRTVDTFLYLDDFEDWQEVPANIDVPSQCPAGFASQCIIVIGGVNRRIYKADHSPYLRS